MHTWSLTRSSHNIDIRVPRSIVVFTASDYSGISWVYKLDRINLMLDILHWFTGTCQVIRHDSEIQVGFRETWICRSSSEHWRPRRSCRISRTATLDWSVSRVGKSTGSSSEFYMRRMPGYCHLSIWISNSSDISRLNSAALEKRSVYNPWGEALARWIPSCRHQSCAFTDTAACVRNA